MTDQDLNQMVKQGCFVQLHFSKPTLKTQLTWEQLGHKQLDKVVSAPSTKPPSKSFNEFGKLESRARKLLATHSTGRKGLRFMYFTHYGDFVKEVQPILDAYHEHVPVFLGTWEPSVQEALRDWQERAAAIYNQLAFEHRANLGSQEDFCKRVLARLRRSWPDAATLQTRFHAELEVQQFAFGGGGEADMSALNPEMIADMKRRAEETFQRFMTDSMVELRQRAVDTVRRMHSVLVQGETVTERSINPLREFVEQFKKLQVVPDTEFQARLEGLVQTIDGHGGAEAMRESTDVWLSVQDLAEEIAQEGEALVQQAIIQNMGPGKRRIQL